MTIEPVEIPDLDRVYDLTAKAIEARGVDFVYPKSEMNGNVCQYEHNGGPSCIVGHVLHYLGVPLAPLDGLDEASAEDVVEYVFEGSFPKDAKDFLQRLQRLQDSGVPWGRANEIAREGEDAVEAAMGSIDVLAVELRGPDRSMESYRASRRAAARQV